eukprot:GFYU01018598.1.p1 GENE.GFYU01018598.1~~GFYU01018598.1.p1  ORF type:complete len:439 (-),score=70.47 GFYU01018598.1:177-1493(-)
MDQTTLDQALAKANALYLEEERGQFTSAKEKKAAMEKGVEEIVNLLSPYMDSSGTFLGSFSAKQKAMALYMQGKAFSCVETKLGDAITLLSKAVKLDPTIVDGWNALGQCFWKRSDLANARNCFKCAIDQKPTKESHQYLSQVLKHIGVGTEEESANIDASIDHAKKAIAMDMADSTSWYILGNAYMKQAFVSGEIETGLNAALKSYKQSEARCQDKPFADLHFNRANVYIYLEEYQSSVQELMKAHSLDPTLPAMALLSDLESFFGKVQAMIAQKGKIKSRKLQQLLSGLASEKASFTDETRAEKLLSELSDGDNFGAVVHTKVVAVMSKPTDIPRCFVLCDTAGMFVCASIYGIADGAIKVNDTLSICDPLRLTVKVSTNDTTHWSYDALKLKSVFLISINGKPVSKSNYQIAALQMNPLGTTTTTSAGTSSSGGK